MTNRLKKFWLGDVDLWISFWIFGVCAVTLLPSVLVFIFVMIGIKFSIDTPNLFGILGGIIFLAYGIFVIVGIWRSASKYQGSKKWSLLAKLVIIGFIILLIYNVMTLPHQLEFMEKH